jgi:hypothetical protein
VTSPKPARTATTFWMSFFIGATSTATSSTYREVLKIVSLPRSSCSWPWQVALSRISVSRLVARPKGRDNSGSPCQRPLLCHMGEPVVPLRRTQEKEVESKYAIQLRNRLGKPCWLTRSTMYSQRMNQMPYKCGAWIGAVWSCSYGDAL